MVLINGGNFIDGLNGLLIKYFLLIYLVIFFNFDYNINTNIDVAAIPEDAKGIVILKIVWMGLHPSIAADSSNSFGIASKNAFISHVANGISIAVYIKINNVLVSSKFKYLNIKYNGTTAVTGGKSLVASINIIKLLPHLKWYLENE